MNNIILNKGVSAVILILIGIAGIMFAPLAVKIASIVVIVYGIYNLFQKILDTGIILIILGLGFLIIYKFMAGVVVFMSIACIVIGAALFIVYLINKA